MLVVPRPGSALLATLEHVGRKAGEPELVMAAAFGERFEILADRKAERARAARRRGELLIESDDLLVRQRRAVCDPLHSETP